MNKVFTLVARTRGALQAAFVFEDAADYEKWRETQFPHLDVAHGGLTLTVEALPGLKIGDTCKVYGEECEIFTIKSLVRYQAHRYGFILDNGCAEEVAKCY